MPTPTGTALVTATKLLPSGEHRGCVFQVFDLFAVMVVYHGLLVSVNRQIRLPAICFENICLSAPVATPLRDFPAKLLFILALELPV